MVVLRGGQGIYTIPDPMFRLLRSGHGLILLCDVFFRLIKNYILSNKLLMS
jgi:hypothetical protein